MNASLLALAATIIPNDKLLINMVRLRVRQLSVGHRPLILAPPGMGSADIALSEIAAGKIESETGNAADLLAGMKPPTILNFPSGKASAAAA
jgi:hypothetical protein